MKKSRKLNRRHFTLTELMVVIVILVLLASIATPMVFRHIRNARIAAAKSQIQNLETAIRDFHNDTKRYPESLDELINKPDDLEEEGENKWDGPYLEAKKGIPKDPWGNEYHYETPGQHNEDSYDLCSYGADGAEGGEGENADITNWKSETEE